MNKCEINGYDISVFCLLYEHSSGLYGSFPQEGEKYNHNQEQLKLLRQYVIESIN